jgi:hypothetical protein
MNTTKRLVFGVLASLLLAVGFAQAANRLDPVSLSVGAINGVLPEDPAPGPGSPCEDGGTGEP